MSKKRAFVRYSKQGKIVPGSLILTSGSYPNGPSTWSEVPADLCCLGPNDYTSCIAIQAIGESTGFGTFEYGFTLQTKNNGGPNVTGTVYWTATEKESFTLPANGNDYELSYVFVDQIPHTIYLCIDNPSQIQDFEIGFGPGQAASISNLQKLEGIDEWDGDDMLFTTLDFTGLTSFDELTNTDTGLQHINITGCFKLIDVNLNGNALTEASVDHVLITLDGNGLSNGVLDLGGGTNSAPSATGLTAVLSLQAKGWTVIVNP